MRKYFRSSVFVVVLALMAVGVGQPRGRGAFVEPDLDPACLALCQQQNLECFFNVTRPSDAKKCTAEYRRCIAHCK